MGNQKPTQSNNDKSQKKLSSLKVFLAGSISGILSAILLQPLNVLKTRLQNPNTSLKDKSKSGRRIVGILSHIQKHEHISSLWAGTVPTILRNIPGGGIYFYLYDILKRNFFENRKRNTIESLLMGIVIRAVTDITVMPLTVVKTRAESGLYHYNGVFAAVKNIYRQEGARGLTSGLVPILLRDCPLSGIYVMFYNESHSLIPKDFCNTHPSAVHSSCAALSCVIASVFTHPPDVLKTQMQLYPGKYPSLWSVTTRIYDEHGIPGYFQGIVPRLLKRTVFAAISWPLYEKVALLNKPKEGYNIKYE